MTARLKKTQRQEGFPKWERIGDLRASMEDDVLALVEEQRGPEARWKRPLKRRISMRVDAEVVDWLQSKGPGYQTRINRILRRVMVEGKKKAGGGE